MSVKYVKCVPFVVCVAFLGQPVSRIPSPAAAVARFRAALMISGRP
jgi:hypothetical protein